MRLIHAGTVVAALLLAACSGGADTDGDGTISTEEASVEAAKATVVQRPGRYQVSTELLEFDAPDVPDGVRERMRDGTANLLSQSRFVCLTQEDVADGGVRMMMSDLAEGNCTLTAFDVSDAAFGAEMRCAGEAGMRTIEMEGEATAETSTITAVTSEDLPGAGVVTSTTSVVARRTGDCSA